MTLRRPLQLLDSTGHPLAAHIERALLELRPRLQRQFPVLQDEVLLLEVLEEAGRRIALHEMRDGPIEKLHGFTWVTLRSVAISVMRRGSMRLIQQSLGSDASRDLLAALPTQDGSPEQVERRIVVRQALDHLSEDERLICIWKTAGFSSRSIARHQRSSIGAVDLLFFRAKEKLRRVLGLRAPSKGERFRPPQEDAHASSALADADVVNETDDNDGDSRFRP